MDAPHERETPHPSELGGRKGNGAGFSGATPECAPANDTRRTADDYSRERYRLDTQIKLILRGDAAHKRPGEHAANVHRTVGCTWIRVDNLALVKPHQRDSYHYKGLMTCGSVHTCPICSAKIQERRRQEVAQVIAFALRQRKATVMASYTFPHRLEQPLSLLLKLQQAAIKTMREGRGYKELMTHVEHAGRVRTLEVTHGRNGWHPHTHELLLLSPDVDAAWLQLRLAKLWFKACAKVGLFQPDRDDELAFLLHAVDVRGGDAGAAGYLAKMDDQTKWGLSHEMTKGSSKQGRRSGQHPFKLATARTTHALFLEYVWAMKGQRQLVWSRGLKASIGIEEKTDEEIAKEESAKLDDRIPIPTDAWRFVIGNDARWELTHAAKIGGAPAVTDYLTGLGYSREH